MLSDLSTHRIFFFNQPTDMRKGFNGLSGLINGISGTNLHNGDVFVFINRNKDKLKLLQWDRSGFAIYYKHLERGSFEWPTQEARQIEIDTKRLHDVLDGISLVDGKQRIRFSFEKKGDK